MRPRQSVASRREFLFEAGGGLGGLALAVALLMLENSTAQLACAVAAALLLLAGAIYTIVHPKLGLVDRLLGTRMVPR